MTQPAPYPSIAAAGNQIARIAEQHIDRAFRHVLLGEQVTSEPRYVRLITGEPHPLGNFAVVSDPADAAGVKAAIEPLVRIGAPAAVLLAGAASAEVVETLQRAGFDPAPSMPAMAVDIDSLKSAALPAGYTMARVGSGPEGDEWGEAFAIGYEIPGVVGTLFSPNAVQATTASDAPIQFFAIRKAGRIVCTSLLFLAEGVAGIYCVATIAEERGRGLGGFATAEPLRLARRLGYGVGVLQSSQAGYSVYRGLGFTDVGGVPLFVRMPG